VNQSVFQQMAGQWPSNVVAREEIHRFSGGIYSARYMANVDCKGLGPANRYRCGRKVFYPVSDLIQWLSERTRRIPVRKCTIDE
jgi:hypothetical protein